MPPFSRPAGLLAWILLGTAMSAAARTDITVKGSDTMLTLMRHWARAYSKTHPGVSIQVTGGGSRTGIAALVNGTTQICMASRPISPDEVEAGIKAFLRRPLEFVVARDAMAIFVNERNPVRELTLAQVAGLFTGETGNWSELGGQDAVVVLYGRENSSGTYEFFKERVLEGRDFAPRAQSLPGPAAVLSAVARDPAGIGYGRISRVAGVRPLAIRGAAAAGAAVLPRDQTITDGTYPVSRSLHLYVNPALHRGPVAEFLEWIRGEEGRGIVREAGYFPLPPGTPFKPRDR
jgi:phosphate transport system substrate-binding protein